MNFTRPQKIFIVIFVVIFCSFANQTFTAQHEEEKEDRQLQLIREAEKAILVARQARQRADEIAQEVAQTESETEPRLAEVRSHEAEARRQQAEAEQLIQTLQLQAWELLNNRDCN